MVSISNIARPGVLFLCLLSGAAQAAKDGVLPGTVRIATSHSFATLVSRMEQAISANKMGLVARASASRGAARRGIKIPGNEVLMVFRNDYAVRMLEASVPAGYEAPLRIYVIENSDATATIIYRRPSAVFAPYHNQAIDHMAQELDPIIARIVNDAAEKK